jgi:glycosyltransferase involved in cell wall biosynthesis
MPRKRILIAHPYLTPKGGANGLAAWALEGLTEHYDVVLACINEPNFTAIDRYFDTHLQDKQIQVRPISKLLNRMFSSLPTRSFLLRHSLLQRHTQKLMNSEHFDGWISTQNEFVCSQRGIQYIHFPTYLNDRHISDFQWYHKLPIGLNLYRKLCCSLSGYTIEKVRKNISIVNSSYIKKIVDDHHGIDSSIVYPPSHMPKSEIPWEARKAQFVCLGRISPEKEVPKIIRIINQVREAGHLVNLQIIGPWDYTGAEGNPLKALIAEHSDWLQVHDNPSRDKVIQLLSESRYGIHGMVGEHFGMAVAEMQQAGCVTFVTDIGGPCEIVGDEAALIYSDEAEAVLKIRNVLEDPASLSRLRAHVEARQGLFSETRFMREIFQQVERLTTD